MALINVETQIIYKWNTIKLAYWEQPPRMQRKKWQPQYHLHVYCLNFLHLLEIDTKQVFFHISSNIWSETLFFD